jgi:subtilisin family serine protease
MIARIAFGFLLAMTAVFATPAIAAPAIAVPPSLQPSDREILVMLDLPPPHYRPGSGYGGSYGSSASSVARKRVALQIARDDELELVDSWPMPMLGVDCYVMRVPAGVSMTDAIAKVSRHPGVKWSQPLQLYRAKAAAAGDPLFKTAPAATEWHLAALHKLVTGRGVKIAVIDSKIDVQHPDLAGQFTVDKNFVTGASTAPELHGTGVAGVIGAKENNGVGIAGIAPGARMMALRACWQTGRTASATLCDTLSLAKALQYAVGHGAQVINLSLSGPPDPLLQKLIGIALDRRVTVVAAYDSALPRGGFPASQRGVVAVTQDSLRNIPASLYGAPGQNVPTTQPGDTWNFVSGSSYAAAHVSGLVALEREERGPSAAISFARSANGAIDACATLVRTASSCNCDCAIAREVAVRR